MSFCFLCFSGASHLEKHKKQNATRHISDSNIFIYLSQKLLSFDKVFGKHDKFSTSIISYMEVMGFNSSNNEEKEILENLFSNMSIHNIEKRIVDKVITIRQSKKIKLPDAIVYATASINNMDLITRNVDDFKNIDNTVKVINPFMI